MKPKTERNAGIVQMRQSGMKPYEIADALGVSRNTVIGVLNRAGLCREGHHARGEEHGRRVVLTEADVRAIRARYQPRSRVDGAVALAREMGVHPKTVESAARGRNWSHVQ
jgi:hypothetical protein